MRWPRRSGGSTGDFLAPIGDVLARAHLEAIRSGRETHLTDLIVSIVRDPGVAAALQGMGRAVNVQPFRGEPAPVRSGVGERAGIIQHLVEESGEIGVSRPLRALLDEVFKRWPNATRAELLIHLVDGAAESDAAVVAALAGMKLDREVVKAAIRRAFFEDAVGTRGVRRRGRDPRRRGLSHLDLLLSLAEPLLLRAWSEAVASGRREIALADVALSIVTDPLVAASLDTVWKAPGVQALTGKAEPVRAAAGQSEGMIPDSAVTGGGVRAIHMSRPVRRVLQEFSTEVGHPAPDLIPWMYLRFLQEAVDRDPAVLPALAGMKLDSEVVEMAIRRAFRLPI